MIANVRCLFFLPAMAGCVPHVEQTISTSSTAHVQTSPTPHKVTLVDESFTVTNGKLTLRTLKFDLARRQPRRIDLGEVSSIDGVLVKGMSEASVTITIQQTKTDHVKLKVQTVEKHKEGQSSTSFTYDINVAGGVKGVTKATDKELNPPGGKSSVLLRWVDPQARKSRTLVVKY